MKTDFKLYKVDIKYIRNLHNIDDKVLSVSPQTAKDNRVFVGIVVISKKKHEPRGIFCAIGRCTDCVMVVDGAPIAYMSANILSAYRTGAVPGVMSKTALEAAMDSDIVSVSTYSPTGDPNPYPYIAEEWIKPGAIIKSTAALRFDDDFIINRARTVTDNIMLYEAWEEEMKPDAYNTIPIPAVRVEDLIAQGRMTSEQIDDLGDVLLGNIPVHRKEDEIVIYSVGGMPTEDVAWGTVVYRNALKKGIGTKLNLWKTPDMMV